MTKKAGGNSLQAILARASSATPDSGVAEPVAAEAKPTPAKRARRAAAPTAEPAPEQKPARRVVATRQGTKMISGHFAPELSAQLRMLAIEEGSSVQALLEEAITDLLTKKAARKVGR